MMDQMLRKESPRDRRLSTRMMCAAYMEGVGLPIGQVAKHLEVTNNAVHQWRTKAVYQELVEAMKQRTMAIIIDQSADEFLTLVKQALDQRRLQIEGELMMATNLVKQIRGLEIGRYETKLKDTREPLHE